MRKLFFTLLANAILISIFAQAPQEINYQGVARNSSGTLLSNQNIGIKLDLHQGSAGGTIVFSETHNKTTNAFGLFTLGIGSVNTASFTGINWANGPYFLEVSMDPAGGTSYSSVGTQQFMSVPYALYAQTAGNASATPTITINAPNTVTSSAGSYTINVPAAISYSAGTGIDITGGVISNTAIATTPTITGTGATTVTGTYPNLTINTPTVAPDQIVSLTGTGNATVTGSYPNFTVNVPNGSNLPNALSGQFLYHTGTVWDTLPRTNLYFDGTNFGIGTTAPQANFHVVGAGRFDASVTTNQIYANNINLAVGTFTNAGDVLTNDGAGNGTWQALPTPTLSYNNGTNVLSLSQGTIVTTATLNGTGSSTINMVGSGLATVTPTSGSTFTVSVPNPTLSIGSGSISISNGNSVAIPSPSLSINSNSLTINGPGGNTVLLPTASTTSLTQGANITVAGSAPNYTVSAPAYSISLPGGNVAQITNGISTSTAAINATSLTLTGANNNILSAGGNTVALNTYTAGTGITISGTAPNYTLASPNQSLSITGNSLSISGANTVTIPTSTVNGLGTGIATVTTSVNNFTVNVPAPTYTAANGVLGFGTNTVDITPTLSLTGTTLTSGAATNSVSLAGLNGIYGGSGAIQTGSTTVTVGTNTLTFLSGTTLNKPIANFFGGGITGTSMNLGHIGANSASLKFIGSATTTPVDYGYISGSTNGISISGGTSTNGLYATNSAEVGVGSYTTGTGKFVITHTASQTNPTMHLRETSGGLNRIKYSNNTVANKFFETAAQTNAVDANGAYSINYFDGTTYKPVLLVTGERKVNINNLNTVLGSLHVMENGTTAGNGIISEGFAQAAQINLARNNQPALAARTAVVSGDELGRLNFAGYDGAAFGDGAKIYAKAAENVTGSNKGTELIFAAVPTGTNTNKEVFKINGTNKLEVITGMVIPLGAANGKVLTSDALGNVSWQTVGGSSPWIQGTGIVTQSIIGDKVGIGTNTPSAQLTIANTYTAAEGLFVDNNSNTNGVRVYQGGSGSGFFSHIGTAAGGSGFIGMTQANSAFFSGTSFGTGRTAEFYINNAANTSEALYAATNGGGSALKVINTNTLSGTGIEASTNAGIVFVGTSNSNGSVIFANNTSTGRSIEAYASSNTAVYATNSSSASAAIYANNSGGSNAIYAINNSSTTAAVYASNSGTYDGLMAHSTGGRAIYAQSNSTGGYSALEAIHYGTGTTIMATKASGTTGGSVAIFNNASSSNGADAVYVSNSGPGAVIRAVNTSTAGTNAALMLEDGHIVVKQNVGGSVSSSSGFFTSGGTTDVAGFLEAFSNVSIGPGGSGSITYTFGKTYTQPPFVTVTPNNAPAAKLEYYVTTTSTSFTINYFNPTGASITILSNTGFFYSVTGWN